MITGKFQAPPQGGLPRRGIELTGRGPRAENSSWSRAVVSRAGGGRPASAHSPLAWIGSAMAPTRMGARRIAGACAEIVTAAAAALIGITVAAGPAAAAGTGSG